MAGLHQKGLLYPARVGAGAHWQNTAMIGQGKLVVGDAELAGAGPAWTAATQLEPPGPAFMQNNGHPFCISVNRNNDNDNLKKNN
jgi:hypothetical protein